MPDRRSRPSVILGALCVGAFAYALSQTMLVPSLPQVEQAFDTTPSRVTLLMSAFFLSGAVTVGVFGRLGDMFGKRRLILVVLAVFVAGSAVCAVAPTLPAMAGGRLLMGCGGALFPLAYSLLRDEMPSGRVTGSIALLGGLVASGAAVGVSIGGLVSDAAGFRAIFWGSVALGLASAAAVAVFVPESPVRTGGTVDVVGAMLLAAGTGASLLAITEAAAWGWLAPRTLVLLLGGALVLGVFVRYELHRREPLIDVPTLLLPRIRLTNAATFFVGVAFFGFSTILTQFFQEPASTGYGPGADATQAGLYLLPGLVALALSTPLWGRLSTRADPVLTLRLGLLVATAGMLGMTLAHSESWELYLWPVVSYVGIGAILGSVPAIVLQNVPPERSGQSTAVNMIVRTTGSALGVQLAAALVTASIGRGGDPSEAGYVAAFALITGAGAVAFALALALPRRRPTEREASADGLAPAVGMPPA